MTDVFISYSRGDRDKVRLIAYGLAAEGFAVWWDPEIKPGKKWNDAIRRALDNAAAVVTVWSPKSVKSDWVVAETTHGSARKSLVPVTIKDCSPPIPYNMIQSADLTRWRGNADDGEWMAVLRQVRALVEAKRRMLAGAPPPGEAHGAEARLGPAKAASEDVGRYTSSGARGRMGPRASRVAMGAVVATVVISGGLWMAQGALTEMGVLAPKTQSAPTATVAPSPAISPDPSVSVTQPPEAPAPTAEPATPAAPAPVTPTKPPETVPPARPDDRAALDGLDSCAQEFARLCPRAVANASPVGFRSDGSLAAGEQKFLVSLQFDVSRPVATETAAACKARLGETAVLRRRASSGTVLSNACATLTWPATTPPVTTTPPATTTSPTRNPPVVTTPPQRTTPSISTNPERIPSNTATVNTRAAEETKALDACVAALSRFCPAPQPTTGFSADGALSRQETTLLGSVAPNARTNADRLKTCTSAAASLQRLSAERRAAGTFGEVCRSLAPAQTLNPNLVRATKTPTVVTPTPAPPR